MHYYYYSFKKPYRTSGAKMLFIPPSFAFILRHRLERVGGWHFVTFLACTHCVAIPSAVSPTRFTSAVRRIKKEKNGDILRHSQFKCHNMLHRDTVGRFSEATRLHCLTGLARLMPCVLLMFLVAFMWGGGLCRDIGSNSQDHDKPGQPPSQINTRTIL